MIESELSILQKNPDLVRLNPELARESRPPRRKYGNVPTVYRGRRYDSVKEARYAEQLDLQVKSGDVIAWFPQVWFDLSPGIRYRADFVVILPGWTVEVVDVKGLRTRDYRLKARLFETRYGRRIVER